MALVSSFYPESIVVKVVCLKKYPLATLALLYDLRTLSFLDEFRLKAHKATCPTFTNACPNQIFFKCLSHCHRPLVHCSPYVQSVDQRDFWEKIDNNYGSL